MNISRLGCVACLTASSTATVTKLKGDVRRRFLQLLSSRKQVDRRRHSAIDAVDGICQRAPPALANRHPYWALAAASFGVSRTRLTEIRAAGAAARSCLNCGSAATHFALRGCRQAALGGIVQRVVRCLLLFLRAARVVALLLLPLILYLAASAATLQRRRSSGGKGNTDRVWRSALVSALARCGPTAVKFGQWASTRRDLFSPELCSALSRLQREVRQHEWKHTRDVLTSHLGTEWPQKCMLDPTPVGSGCVAQVYKGYLCDRRAHGKAAGDGRVPVAVKVLHPGVREAMSDDLSVLRFLASVVEWLVPSARYLNLVGSVIEFGSCLMDQVDLRVEARNLAAFNLKFAGHSFVKFAWPIYPYIASDLLIETFEDGIPVASFLPDGQQEDARLLSWAQAHAKPDEVVRDCRKQIASIGLHAMLKMIFEDNCVHADLHPGNISVQLPEPSAQSGGVLRLVGHFRSALRSMARGEAPWVAPPQAEPVLVLYDCGIVSRLRSNARAHFRDVFAAVLLDQGERVAELFLQHSAEIGCTDVAAFKQQMAKLVHRLRGDSLVLGKVQVGRLLGDVFGLLSRNRIRLEKDFVNIIVAIAVLEGLGRSLDPDTDLLQAANRYLLP